MHVSASADLALPELEGCSSDSSYFVFLSFQETTKAAVSKVHSSLSVLKSSLKVLKQNKSLLLEVYML